MSLLPKIYQKEIRNEKILRLCFVFISVVSAIVLVGIVLMLPSYFTLTFSTEDVLRRLDAQKKTFERQDIKSFEETIKKINQRSALFAGNEKMRHHLADLLIRISEVDDGGIQLNSLYLKSESNGLFNFVIKGTATTRDGFLSYTQRLKGMSEFASVHSPISNLLRERDVPFELDVLIKKESYFYVAKP